MDFTDVLRQEMEKVEAAIKGWKFTRGQLVILAACNGVKIREMA